MSNNTLASRLNRRITLEYPVESADGLGGFTILWTELETLWAEVIPLSAGREVLEASQLQATQMHRFTLRALNNVTADMRIRYNDRIFAIRALRYPDAGKTTLEILAEEGAVA